MVIWKCELMKMCVRLRIRLLIFISEFGTKTNDLTADVNVSLRDGRSIASYGTT